MVNPKRVLHLLMVFTMLGLLLAACGSEQSNAVPTTTPGATIPTSATTAQATTTSVTTTQPANTSTATPIPPTQPANTSTATPIPPTQPATVTPILPTTTALASTTQPLGGNSFSSLSDWWNEKHDASNTNYNPNEKVLTAANVSSLTKKWTIDTSSRYALVWNGFVISRNPKGLLQSYEIDTGKLAATYAGTEGAESFAILNTGRLLVYINQDKGKCLASYDLLSGNQVSCVSPQGSDNNSVSQIVQANNLVLASTFNKEQKDPVAYAFNAQNGQVKWSVKASGDIPFGGYGGDWLVAGNLAILKSSEAVAYDLNSGREIWRKKLLTGIGREILAANGTLVAYERGGGVDNLPFTAYDATNGNLKWSKTLDNAGPGRLLASNGTQVFVSTHNETYSKTDARLLSSSETAYSLDLATGKLLWQQPLAREASSAVLTNDLLFIGAGNTVSALQATTGKLLYKLDLTEVGDYISHLAVAEGHLIVTGKSGDQYRTFVYGLK